MADNTPALRKRQQIENANKMMFIWVAIAAAILAVSAVVSISLYQRIEFKQRIINAKIETVNTLKNNNEVSEELKKNVRVLNTNEALMSTTRIDGTEPLSVVLDALPSTANSSALGASLQQKLLAVDGVSIDSLVVDPISGVENGGEDESAAAVDGATSNTISFQFSVSTSQNQESKLQDVLRNLERSIRAINLTSVSVENQGSGSRISMVVEGQAFYKPATTVELKEKSIKP